MRIARFAVFAVLAATANHTASPQSDGPVPDVKTLTEQARAGDPIAQLRLGSAYDLGRGVRRNLRTAEKWYRASAAQGNAEAQNAVGSILQERKKFAEALMWYEQAAASGFAPSINSAGYLYDLGLGVPQDRRKGHDYYLRAAHLGWAESMWNLANIYALGQIGPVDYFQACLWGLRAKRYAAQSEVLLRERVQAGDVQIRRELTADQYDRCSHQANEWKPEAAAGPAL